MKLNLETVNMGLEIFQGILIIGGFFYTWRTNKKRQSDSRIVKVEKSIKATSESLSVKMTETKAAIGKRLDGHDDRLKDVEAACNHAPGYEELEKVYTRINGISEQLSGLIAGQEALQRNVDMISEFLLSQSGGK